MSLDSGWRLGQYEILAQIGAGGMGEVYRARDTTLKRDVALKVLPAAFLHDPERIARFQREAEVLASLDHPNVGPIYGMVESEGARALVLALVEGPTLDERIATKALPPEEAWHVARQIVDALEYAHDRGVIHRDLKPANVKITPEGVAKVLDFGLAKILEDDHPQSSGTHSPTLTQAHTRAGVILGTAAYMSPEQAVGKTVDRRSDIFSFGAVLYEMLTGQRAFAGTTTGDTLASVVKDDPDWGKLPAATPTAIRKLLRRCLIKDRRERLQAIGEARIVLRNPAAEEPAPATARSRSRLGIGGWMAAGILAPIAGVALWAWLEPTPPEPRAVTRFTVPFAEAGRANFRPPVLSRDGSRLAIVGGPGQPISLRTMDQFDTTPVPGTEGASDPCFSPDGQWIAYTSLTSPKLSLKKVPVSGGAALALADAGADLCHWGDDGSILFGGGPSGLFRVSSDGGKPENLAAPDVQKGELAYSAPQLLPGGKTVLFSILGNQGFGALKIAALDLATGDRKVLLEDAGVGWYAPTGPDPGSGHIVYGRNGSLFAVPFDVNRLQVGSPAPLLDGVSGSAGLVNFGFSESGTLAYMPTDDREVGTATLVWVDRKGAAQPVAAPARNYDTNVLRLSPDGGRAAVQVRDPAWIDIDLWTYDLARGGLNRVTFGGTNAIPAWTADGTRLIYAFAEVNQSRRAELRSVLADGSGRFTTLLASEVPPPYVAQSVSPDGKVLLGTRGREPGNAATVGQDIWDLLLDSGSPDAKPRPFLESPFNKRQARFSPGGRWVAYTSNESGRSEIYVVPYPGPGAKSQVSTEGGTAPTWARDGRELYYRNGDRVMAVDVETGTSFRARTPRLLFERAGITDGFDVAPDGRFLMIAPSGQQVRANELRVVVNWFEELRRRVPLRQ